PLTAALGHDLRPALARGGGVGGPSFPSRGPRDAEARAPPLWSLLPSFLCLQRGAGLGSARP
ncbi:Hypothetical predicted protein, partial [Marmota monax]